MYMQNTRIIWTEARDVGVPSCLADHRGSHCSAVRPVELPGTRGQDNFLHDRLDNLVN
jgi:hypothetical protein